MARITHLRDALIPLVLFISIFVVSVVDASDVVDAEFGLEFSEAGPLSQNTSSSFDMTDLGFPHLLQKRACPVGSSLCINSGRCCRDPYDGCCKDGTCGRLSVDSCCPGGGLCRKDEICCDGCAPPGSTCCSSGKYCRKGYKCCDSRCIPEGSRCCTGGYYCPSTKYCMLVSGSMKCCRTTSCLEYTSPDDDDDKDSITRPPSTTTSYEPIAKDSVYYTDISWTYYYYWYIYVYIIVEVEVTTTTMSLTSTPTVTSSRMSVSASDSGDARDKFRDMSSSLEKAAASEHKQESTPTSGTVTIATTPAPCATDSTSPGCAKPDLASLDVTPGLWKVLGMAMSVVFMAFL